MNKLTLKIKRYELMEKHQQLVAQGNFDTAHELLDFIQTGSISLGLDDAGWECEKILEHLGFYIYIDPRWFTAKCKVEW